MDSFDLGRLSDYDFEVLCRDLFEEILGLKIEIFARGADGGIDLRYMAADGSSVVIQCKHWARSGRAKLVAHMRDRERPKIAKLRPARYILATSVELTADAKDTLLEELSPFVRTAGDLYGVEQIAEELRKRPGLVRRHFRLWLSGTTVLQEVLHQDLLLRSADLLGDLDDAAKTFVPTPAFDAARDLLDRESICLLAGIPGIGKTTIARMLARIHVEDGYQVVDVSRDIDEVYQAWLPATPQLFLYDDFLGQIALEHQLGKNEDRRLLRVMQTVRKTTGKLLVLTTREYILREAKRRYERLDDGDLEPLTCDVEDDSLSDSIRANILYNHVYHSRLSPAERARFADRSTWSTLVRHRNFSPRLVERTLRLTRRDGTEGVADVLRLNFDNPERIWAQAIDEDLEEPAVHVLEVLFTFDRAAVLDSLREVWRGYRRALARSDDLRLFDRAVKVLDGSMIRVQPVNTLFTGTEYEALFPTFEVDFHNPSIRDYMLTRIRSNPLPLDTLLETIDDARQVEHLVTLASDQSETVMRETLRGHRDRLADALIRDYEANSKFFGDDTWADDLERLLDMATVLASLDLAEYVVAELEFDSTDPREAPDRTALVSLAARLETTTLIQEETRLRLAAELLDEAIADRQDAEDPIAAQWVVLADLAGILTDSPVTGAKDRLLLIRHEMIDLVHRELGEWLTDESRKTREHAHAGSWAQLAGMLASVAPGDLPPQLSPGHTAAAAAAEAHRSASRPPMSGAPRPSSETLPDHAFRPLDPDPVETFRVLLEEAN